MRSVTSTVRGFGIAGTAFLALAGPCGCGTGAGTTTPPDGSARGDSGPSADHRSDSRRPADAMRRRDSTRVLDGSGFRADMGVAVPGVEAHVGAGGLAGSPQTTPPFSTTNAGDLIVAIVFADGGTGAPAVSDGGGSTWTLQYGGTSGLAGECGATWVFFAQPGRVLAGDTVTASRSGATYLGVAVIAATGFTGFDANPGLPAVAMASGCAMTAPATYSTTTAGDLIVGASTTCHAFGTSWTGLTLLDNLNDEFSVAAKATTSVQTGATASVTTGPEAGIVVFALSP